MSFLWLLYDEAFALYKATQTSLDWATVYCSLNKSWPRKLETCAMLWVIYRVELPNLHGPKQFRQETHSIKTFLCRRFFSLEMGVVALWIVLAMQMRVWKARAPAVSSVCIGFFLALSLIRIMFYFYRAWLELRAKLDRRGFLKPSRAQSWFSITKKEECPNEKRDKKAKARDCPCVRQDRRAWAWLVSPFTQTLRWRAHAPMQPQKSDLNVLFTWRPRS